MKRRITSLFVLFSLLVLFAGCIDFEPATLKMEATYDPESRVVTCDVTIVNDGGCINFTEQGGIYSLNEVPSHLDQYSTVEVVERNTKETTFRYQTKLTLNNTKYYIRTYVKTNAGTGYSDIVSFDTSSGGGEE
jgi:hypothetical protein